MPGFRAKWETFTSRLRLIHTLHFDEATISCVQCLNHTLRYIATGNTSFSGVKAATLRIQSLDGLQIMKILPSTISSLRIFVTYDMNIATFIALTARFTSLEALHLQICRPEYSPAYTLSMFQDSVPWTLQIFHIEDSIPVQYTNADLEIFLHSHSRLQSLCLDPHSGAIELSSVLTM